LPSWSINRSAFEYCGSLTNIAVDSGNPNYTSAGGVVFVKTITTLIQCPKGLTGGYLIPNSVTSIGENAFSDCPGLTNVTIPDSVSSIGAWGFAYSGQANSWTHVASIGRWFDGGHSRSPAPTTNCR